jgi:inhibitor of cysteine peptidase
MGKRIFFLLLVSIFVLSFAACGQAGDPTVTLTDKDAGSTVELKVGQLLVIDLPGNVTTGYNWEAVTGYENILEQQGEPQVTPESSAIGAPGIISLTFKAIASGETTLQLIYHRSFEPDVAPLETFEVTVQVKG